MRERGESDAGVFAGLKRIQERQYALSWPLSRQSNLRTSGSRCSSTTTTTAAQSVALDMALYSLEQRFAHPTGAARDEKTRSRVVGRERSGVRSDYVAGEDAGG